MFEREAIERGDDISGNAVCVLRHRGQRWFEDRIWGRVHLSGQPGIVERRGPIAAVERGQQADAVQVIEVTRLVGPDPDFIVIHKACLPQARIRARSRPVRPIDLLAPGRRGSWGTPAVGGIALRRFTQRHYGSPVRTNLTVEDLGDLLDRPLVAVLATLRTDGTVLLSPVYHEWRDGGFNIWVEQQNVKARHLRRDPRATILVAESDPPLRAVEVRGKARFIEEGVSDIALRIVTRYDDPEGGAADVEALRGADVIIRVEPGDVRVWDYADELG